MLLVAKGRALLVAAVSNKCIATSIASSNDALVTSGRINDGGCGSFGQPCGGSCVSSRRWFQAEDIDAWNLMFSAFPFVVFSC